MRLYLVQHGEAKAKAEDLDRPLTDQGRLDVDCVAAFARRGGVQVHQIQHSGKRRAEETAAILAEHLQPPGGVVALPGLAPKDNVQPSAELLRRETRPLMIVGHQPFLERLVSFLVTGREDRAIVEFHKGGIVCIEREPRTRAWVLQWAVTPDLIPHTDLMTCP